MKEPRSIKDIFLEIASNPDDPFGKVLLKCPEIQKELTKRPKEQKRRMSKG